MNAGFKLTIQLKTPASIHRHMSLDALLAAALFKKMGAVDRALKEIPLGLRDEVWCGSSVRFDRGHFAPATFTQALRASDLDSMKFTDQRRRGGGISVLTAGGDYKPSLDTTNCWIGRISFLGYGDGEACKALIDSLPGIGAHAGSHGLGRMEWTDVEDTDTDGLAEKGLPIRVIPLSFWVAWGNAVGSETGVDQLRWRPPYWAGNPDECVFPCPAIR